MSNGGWTLLSFIGCLLDLPTGLGSWHLPMTIEFRGWEGRLNQTPGQQPAGDGAQKEGQPSGVGAGKGHSLGASTWTAAAGGGAQLRQGWEGRWEGSRGEL